jgi:hypothetical protein
MVFVVLLFVYGILIITSRIVWKSFYKHHRSYHFCGSKENRLFGFIGHRWLSYLFTFHMIVVAILASIGLLYVW